MHVFKRADRVAKLLREEISQIIMRELKDPLVGFVTITTIKLTDDLKLARIYVGILGDQEAKNRGLKGLTRAVRFIRTELGHRTNLKYVPELEFYYDDTLEYAQNIDSLLKKIHKG